MLYRYVAVSDDDDQGLITFISFLEELELPDEVQKQLNRADIFIETYLPYPLDENGNDIYAFNRLRNLVAYFTEDGNDFFLDAMTTLVELTQKYAWDFGYAPQVQKLDEVDLDHIGEVLYSDTYQIIIATD